MSSRMAHGAAAFSTVASAVTSALNDPSLLDDVAWDTSETFNVVDPGASTEQFEDGRAVIARVRRMGREETKAVSSSVTLTVFIDNF